MLLGDRRGECDVLKRRRIGGRVNGEVNREVCSTLGLLLLTCTFTAKIISGINS